MRQTVMRDDDVLVQAQVRVAFVSGGRARPMPKPLRLALRGDPAQSIGDRDVDCARRFFGTELL